LTQSRVSARFGFERRNAVHRKGSRLLAEIPKGDWVALAHDETRVVAYGAELQNVVRRAKESGEDDPVVIRVPQTEAALLR
jgi:hypothetical protein